MSDDSFVDAVDSRQHSLKTTLAILRYSLGALVTIVVALALRCDPTSNAELEREQLRGVADECQRILEHELRKPRP